jgi:hypothetical protein
MKNIFWFITFLSLFLFTCASCYYDNKDDLYDYKVVEGIGVPCEFTTISFAADVLPILDIQCNGACHNATDREGNVILETYNNITPYVNDGSLMGSIHHTGGFAIMPTSGTKIPSCEIEKLQSWVDAGAPNN